MLIVKEGGKPSSTGKAGAPSASHWITPRTAPGTPRRHNKDDPGRISKRSVKGSGTSGGILQTSAVLTDHRLDRAADRPDEAYQTSELQDRLGAFLSSVKGDTKTTRMLHYVRMESADRETSASAGQTGAKSNDCRGREEQDATPGARNRRSKGNSEGGLRYRVPVQPHRGPAAERATNMAIPHGRRLERGGYGTQDRLTLWTIRSRCESDVGDNQTTSWQASRGTDDGISNDTKRKEPHDEGDNTNPNAQYARHAMVWSELDAIDDIMTLQDARADKGGVAKTIDITVDSGAAEVVAPPMFAAEYITRASKGSRRGTQYLTASGNMVANLGEKKVTMATEGGGSRTMTFQVAGVTCELCEQPPLGGARGGGRRPGAQHRGARLFRRYLPDRGDRSNTGRTQRCRGAQGELRGGWRQQVQR